MTSKRMRASGPIAGVRHEPEKDALVKRTRSTMEVVSPEDLSADELEAILAILEPAANRASDPVNRIHRALDAIDTRGWTESELAQLALTVEAIAWPPKRRKRRHHEPPLRLMRTSTAGGQSK